MLLETRRERFFMDGSHENIVDACVLCVRMALCAGHKLPGIREDCAFCVNTFREVLEFLLDNQYVNAGLQHILHKVVRGSGMGQKHSACVSSICFYTYFTTF